MGWGGAERPCSLGAPRCLCAHQPNLERSKLLSSRVFKSDLQPLAEGGVELKVPSSSHYLVFLETSPPPKLSRGPPESPH